HENKLGLWQGTLELPGGIQAIELGHGDVQNYYLRLQLGGGFQERTPVPHDPDDLETRLQDAFQCVRQHLMVVGQQYPWAPHDFISQRLVSLIVSQLRW